MRIIQLHKNYRRKHNGTDGFIRLTTRCIDSIKKGGLKGLFSSIDMHERSLSPFQHSPSAENLILDDISEEKGQLPNDVAVHVHVFYPDLASEIRSYLENIPVEFHCYVTTDTLEKAKLVEVAFFDMKNASTLDIRVVENRGRDLAPMIVELGRELARHEVVLHIHSKRSPHNLDLRGWRRYLMTLLLGNTQRVTAILNQFSKNERLSILYPNIYLPVIPFMRIGGNASHMMTLLGRSGNDSADFSLINQVDFPAGAMFWFRGKAIEPFLKMHLTLQDFDEENGQCDATLAHAIERLFPYFANKNGLEFQSYSSKQLTSSLSGAMPLSLFHEYYSQRMVKNPVIFFDHNIGGGTNLYSREFIDTIITQESSALRIHYTNGNWFVEWIGIDDGMIFVSTAEAELFDTLGKIACKTIIINSLYNYPDIDDAIFRIINLAKLLNATLDYKVHDFYAICPSQHLIDFNEKYCDVPSDHRYCKMCLEKNLAAHWASSRPLAITEWRYSFSRLFRAVDVISTFDQSTIEILRKAFQIDNYNVRITPHRDDYFNTSSFVFSRGNLHIGILGTLTTVKGAKIVNALGNHIKKQNKRIPITVVGQSMVSTISEIRVLGPYENIHLPEIIHREGINVILMPTIVPETFSYTVSEAMKMGLPIVAFDIGAQGRRVKEYAQGKVVPLGSSSEVILSAIQSSLKALELII
jgi:glycosyltransferase involved in cell wall biosynthesis